MSSIRISICLIAVYFLASVAEPTVSTTEITNNQQQPETTSATEDEIAEDSLQTASTGVETSQLRNIEMGREIRSNGRDVIVWRRRGEPTDVERKNKKCVIVDRSNPMEDIHYWTNTESKLTFYIRPESSFSKVTLKLRLQSILEFQSYEASSRYIKLQPKDLDLGDNSDGWIRVDMEYFQESSDLLDYHAFRVRVGDISYKKVTNRSWFLYSFEGFFISVDGEADLLFNCKPEVLEENEPVTGWNWGLYCAVVAGILLLALLALLCCVCTRIQRRSRNCVESGPPSTPVYDEFDDDFMEKIRMKVEDLRRYKSQDEAKAYVQTHRDNSYVVHVPYFKDQQQITQGNSTLPDDPYHHYETLRFENKGNPDDHFPDGKDEDHHYEEWNYMYLQNKQRLGNTQEENECNTLSYGNYFGSARLSPQQNNDKFQRGLEQDQGHTNSLVKTSPEEPHYQNFSSRTSAAVE